MTDKALHYSSGKFGVDQIPAEALALVGSVYSYGEGKYTKTFQFDKAINLLVNCNKCEHVNFTQIEKLSREVFVEVATINGFVPLTQTTPNDSDETPNVGTVITQNVSETTNSKTKTSAESGIKMDVPTCSVVNTDLPLKGMNLFTNFNVDVVEYAVNNSMFSVLTTTTLREEYGDSCVDPVILQLVYSKILSRVWALHSPTCNVLQKKHLDGTRVVQKGRDNWKSGTNWSEFLGSAKRHMLKWELGESYDKESTINHLGHAIWNLITLYYYQLHELGVDNRPEWKYGNLADMLNADMECIYEAVGKQDDFRGRQTVRYIDSANNITLVEEDGGDA